MVSYPWSAAVVNTCIACFKKLLSNLVSKLANNVMRSHCLVSVTRTCERSLGLLGVQLTLRSRHAFFFTFIFVCANTNVGARLGLEGLSPQNVAASPSP